MADYLSARLLSQVSEFVAERMGFHFPRERWADLEQGIRCIAREFEFSDTESCVQWLFSSAVTQGQIEILASYLTVGETYFFREKQSFRVLEERVLRELIRTRRGADQRMRIWSAGCCTGEEPYSIAILLKQMLADLRDWQITILATDINPQFLKKAADGIYSEWSFRGVSPEIKERYFLKKNSSRFEIPRDIKSMVTFSYLNLAEDTYPSLLNNTNAMDVIFCRNVLMYFAPERARRVIQKFHRSLLDGGWLIVSPSETSHLLYAEFVTVNFPGVTFYRKESHRAGVTLCHGSEQETKPTELLTLSFSFAPSAGAEPANAEPPKKPLPPDAPEDDGVEPARDPYSEAVDLYGQGRYEEAAQALSALLARTGVDSKAMALLARVYANQGKLTEALQWCERAIAADKLSPTGHLLHATILQEKGSIQDAVSALRRALYLDPNLALAHFALGNVARQQGRLTEASKHFENARMLLGANPKEQILPESEGMTAGRLVEIIRATNSDQISAGSRQQGAQKQRLRTWQ
ncbi:MAG: tetratricopeptide repeat protein [Deltaproteobacteria bacterium]|nr:tetratricopeptide repeat protein [Deltaproteobacteria bacterium]